MSALKEETKLGQTNIAQMNFVTKNKIVPEGNDSIYTYQLIQHPHNARLFWFFFQFYPF